MHRVNNLALEIRTIANLMRRAVESCPHVEEIANLTSTQLWILKYLDENRGNDVFQRDLEAEFQVRRSTITGILQGMERKGLIERQSVSHDARLKKITLTGIADNLFQKISMDLTGIDEMLLTGISQEELDTFGLVLNKIKDNIEGNITT